MTNEEKDLLIAYLVDVGELDPDGDLEEQSRTGTRSARARCPRGPLQDGPRGRPGAGAELRGRPQSGLGRGRNQAWAGSSWRPARASTVLWTTSVRQKVNPRDSAAESTWWPQAGQIRRFYVQEASLSVWP